MHLRPRSTSFDSQALDPTALVEGLGLDVRVLAEGTRESIPTAPFRHALAWGCSSRRGIHM